MATGYGNWWAAPPPLALTVRTVLTRYYDSTVQQRTMEFMQQHALSQHLELTMVVTNHPEGACHAHPPAVLSGLYYAAVMVAVASTDDERLPDVPLALYTYIRPTHKRQPLHPDIVSIVVSHLQLVDSYTTMQPFIHPAFSGVHYTPQFHISNIELTVDTVENIDPESEGGLLFLSVATPNCQLVLDAALRHHLHNSETASFLIIIEKGPTPTAPQLHAAGAVVIDTYPPEQFPVPQMELIRGDAPAVCSASTVLAGEVTLWWLGDVDHKRPALDGMTRSLREYITAYTRTFPLRLILSMLYTMYGRPRVKARASALY